MNIVIVGGGTAGWLAAMFISKVKPGNTVTVIESPTIGIVGAGEGSTGTLLDVVNNRYWNFGCNLEDFLKETNATLKYGIKHKDWTTVGEHYYGPIDGSATGNGIPDGIFGLALDTMSDKLHMSTMFGQMMEYNISPINRVTNRFTTDTHALHFDAHLVGNYFKKICLASDNVKLISDTILDVNLNENGFVESLLLESKETVEGDFFIDASGFSKVLMKKLDATWVSYSKHLPVNTAMPFFIDYKEGETPEPYTTAWAQSSGWMWQIPTQTRKGCGYVFCDEFITHEEAHKEIENTLGHEIEPVRFLKFDTGRQEKVWIKNCLSVGLAAAFAEPLEATSIHSTIIQLLNFVFEFLKPTLHETINPASIAQYNRRTALMYDDFKDFLVAHYLGGRTDSEFWRYITDGNTVTDTTDMIAAMCKSRMPTINDFNQYPGAAGWHLWSFVLAGTKQFTSGVGVASLDEYLANEAYNRINKLNDDIEMMKLLNYSYTDFNKLYGK